MKSKLKPPAFRIDTTGDPQRYALVEMTYFDHLPENLQTLLREMDLPIHSPTVLSMCKQFGAEETYKMIIAEEKRIKNELSQQ
jgi:hypothetical protein